MGPGTERKAGMTVKQTDGVKIVTIGGGSSYTPELMEGLINRYDQVPVREIWLVDIEEGKEKLEIVGEMARRMWNASGHDVQVHLTLDRREALKDADFVTTQFRVGLLAARIKDERIPLSYGMAGQETNGAGGIFKALRTIPVILDIVEDMKELCPDAWLVNFTNPSGMVTEAVMKYGHWDKVAGLCNVPVIAMMSEPEAIGKTPEDLTYRFAGLNHFHWHRVWDETGREVTRDLIEAFYRLGRTPGTPANIFDVPFYREQLDLMDMIPCGYHRYYYHQQEMLEHMLEEAQSQAGTRAEQVKQTEDELFELYKDPNLDHKPEQLARRGGAHYSDAACETIASLYADKNTHIVLTTRNNGAIPDLPEDVAVEVSTLVGKDGPKVIPFGALPAGERGLLQVMKAMEQCVEEAAVTGNVGALLEAFTLNPLITAGETARQVMNELLVAHERYLPQFAPVIEQLKQDGVTVKDERVRRLMEEGQ